MSKDVTNSRIHYLGNNFLVELLEGRRFLSASHALSHHHHHGGHGGHNGHGVGEVTFNLTPAAVQTGLSGLAATAGDAAPTPTTEVYLGNRNGVETYTIRETGTGTVSNLTVDIAGLPVTAPTRTSSTFGAINNAAVTDEFNAIATALNATAPASTDAVNVSTPTTGPAVYTLTLTRTSTTNSGFTHRTQVSVDANGNPVGNERVPLSVLPTAIQNGLTSNAPAGATALTPTSLVNVNTLDGVTLYSVRYTATGTTTVISVNSAGTLTSGRTSTPVAFSTLPTAAQTALQSLATAEGVTTAIASDQSVTQTTEANGTVLYTVHLSATDTTDTTETYTISLTVDAAGNPTVLGGGEREGFGGRGFGGEGSDGHFGHRSRD